MRDQTEVERAAREFLQHEAGFAQLVTFTRDGQPVGRTTSAFLNDDWTVGLGLTIPRVVFVRGAARLLDDDETWRVYRAHTERLRAAGHRNAPQRDRAEIDEGMRGVRITPSKIRVEGFGAGAQAFDMDIPNRHCAQRKECDR